MMNNRRGKKANSRAQTPRLTFSHMITACMVFGVFCMLSTVYLHIVTMQDMHDSAHSEINEYMSSGNAEKLSIMQKPVSTTDVKDEHKDEQIKKLEKIGDQSTDPNCTFREYAKKRYYGHPTNTKADPAPPFLTDGLYIRGEYPIILEGGDVNKVCLDHSSWDSGIAKGKRPFVDAQNPSVMSLRLTAGPNSHQPRLDKNNIQPLLDKYGERRLNNMFIASMTVGNGQCRWGETPDEIEQFRISDITKAPTVHGELLILDENMNRLSQTSIKLLSDAKWGKMKENGEKVLVELDDTRLFFFKGGIWLFYRNGGNLGYDKQAHSPLYVELNELGEIEAYIKASEMVPLCCGRNMSIIAPEGSNSLKALTWIDPVTVVEFGLNQGAGSRRLSAVSEVSAKNHGRQLRKAKSDVHGTNGFMIPLPSTKEYLGIAHFHRPEGRGKNPFARHGHHYTHAFFTISDSSPHHLSRMSNEFLFKSQSSQNGPKDDADIIQFAGSIDLIGEDEKNGQLLISYGINDCEGATILIDMSIINSMLKEVINGDEVVALMKKNSNA